jgi:hypothetical protein
MSNKPTEVILHGEAMIFQSEIPADAVEIQASNNQYHIIADSETTGNHHVIDAKAGVKFFKKGNTMYMKNTKPTQVRCVIANRHDAITIEAGTYEFGIQLEWDHFAQNLRNVRD